MRPRDTTPDAHRRQLDGFRSMDPATRVRLAWAMSEEARAMSAAGIRARHPEYSDDEVRLALARLVLGAELAAAAWPGVALPTP